MTSALDPLVLVLAASTAAQIGLGVLSWRFRPIPGSRPLTALMLATAVWACGSIFSLASVSYPANLLATGVAYVGISFAPVAWLFLSLEYAGKDSWITPRTVALANVVPVLTVLAAWTSDAHELLWQFDGLRPVGSFVVLSVSSYGPWFWVHTTYSYVLLAVGSVLFLRTAVHAKRIHRYQVAMLLGAVVVPWVSNVTHLSGLSPVTFDPTPFVFIVSGALFAVALFRYRLLDLPPIARDVVLEEMDDGVVVVDHEDRIVDVNPKVGQLLGVDGAAVVGQHATTLFPPEYVRADDGGPPDDSREDDWIVSDLGDGDRILNLRVSPLYAREGWIRGRVFLLRDVTVRERQRSELERQNEQLKRQNEQLEEFASIVSHDLRNPLTLAMNHLDLVDERDGDHVAAIADAHGEMAAIIEDLLALARQGRVVGDTEPVSLETVARTATAVEAAEATVDLADDSFTIEGDPGRVQQLFENLFRNAVEHAGPAVTVRVGALDDGAGFYVEDDGPGIPPQDRERVFTSGYTDADSGTGLGLAIVENIVKAHGWDVTVTDGTDGGARFEVVTDAGQTTGREEETAYDGAVARDGDASHGGSATRDGEATRGPE